MTNLYEKNTSHFPSYFVSIIFLFLISGGFKLSAQVSINTDGTDPHSSAMLEVKSSDKGLLIPRVALTGTTDITTVTSPAISLMVFNTATVGDVTPGFYYWNAS